jgi:hypothetical protein
MQHKVSFQNCFPFLSGFFISYSIGLRLSDSSFTNNSILSNGSSSQAFGGHIYVASGSGFTIEDSRFIGSSAKAYGVSSQAYGGGLNSNIEGLVLRRCIFMAGHVRGGP